MATYKPIRKTASGTEEIKIPYAVLADPPTIPAAVTSINGLSGGTLTSPLTLTGGDSATASKIILSSNGQITDSGTATMLGFSGGNYIVGSGSYSTTFRGKQTRPTWNGKDLALKSDVPTLPTLATVATTGSYNDLIDKPNLNNVAKLDTANTFTETQSIADGKHLKTNLIKSADDSKWIAEITAAGLEIGGSGTPLRFYSSTRPVVANQNKELAYTSDIPDTSNLVPKSAFSLSGTTLTITI